MSNRVSLASSILVKDLVEYLFGLLSAQATSGAEREWLAGFLHISTSRINPSFGFELHRIVKVFLIVGYCPGAGIHLALHLSVSMAFL